MAEGVKMRAVKNMVYSYVCVYALLLLLHPSEHSGPQAVTPSPTGDELQLLSFLSLSAQVV